MITKDNIKPLGKYVLVKRAEHKKSLGNILLPETSQEKPKEGIVVAVGPGKKDENGVLQPLTVQVNDRVLFSSYAPKEIESSEELLLLSEDDILGILEEAN